MLEVMQRWRFTCETCRVTKMVDAPDASTPRTPDGWTAGLGERGPSGYPKRVHYCEVCTLRALEKEGEDTNG